MIFQKEGGSGLIPSTNQICFFNDASTENILNILPDFQSLLQEYFNIGILAETLGWYIWHLKIEIFIFLIVCF